MYDRMSAADEELKNSEISGRLLGLIGYVTVTNVHSWSL